MVYNAFAIAYAAEFDNIDVSQISFAAQSFDAGWMVTYGIAWAHLNEEEIRGTTIARGFLQLSSGAEVPIQAGSWPTVVESFRQGLSVDLVGASGGLDFGADGEITAPVEIWVFNTALTDFETVSVVNP